MTTFLVQLLSSPGRAENDSSYSSSLSLLDLVSAADLLAGAAERGDASLLVALPNGASVPLYLPAPVTFDTSVDSVVNTTSTSASVLFPFAGIAITAVVLAIALLISLILIAVRFVKNTSYKSD